MLISRSSCSLTHCIISRKKKPEQPANSNILWRIYKVMKWQSDFTYIGESNVGKWIQSNNWSREPPGDWRMWRKIDIQDWQWKVGNTFGGSWKVPQFLLIHCVLLPPGLFRVWCGDWCKDLSCQDPSRFLIWSLFQFVSPCGNLC